MNLLEEIEKEVRKKERANDSRPPIDDPAAIRFERKGGKPYACLVNTLEVLRKSPDWKDRIRYDEFKQRVTVKDGSVREWTDVDDSRCIESIHRAHKFEPKKTQLVDAVCQVADEHKYHPVREYLGGLVWDGTERLSTMLARYFGVEPSAYASGVGTAWMISAVARVMRPGCKVDYMLGLEGDQGKYKSKGLQELCPDQLWFSDTGVKIGSKDSYLALHGNWIRVFDEGVGFLGVGTEVVKSFLTATHDNVRPPYGRRSINFPRQCVFAYTTNAKAYLSDRSGNRRMWPVWCSVVDPDAIARDRDQLWAEARVRFAKGERWWPDDALQELAKGEQESRAIVDPWKEPIVSWLSTFEAKELFRLNVGVSGHEVLTKAIGLASGDCNRREEMRVSELLLDLGFVRQRRMINGLRSWRYCEGMASHGRLGAES